MDSSALKKYPTIISNKYKLSMDTPIRVAFYARVSTAHESQSTSIINQVEYVYTNNKVYEYKLKIGPAKN